MKEHCSLGRTDQQYLSSSLSWAKKLSLLLKCKLSVDSRTAASNPQHVLPLQDATLMLRSTFEPNQTSLSFIAANPQDYNNRGQMLINDQMLAKGNQFPSNLVYKEYLKEKNNHQFEMDIGLQPVMLGRKATTWMHIFSAVLMALLFLEIFQCLGRPNYGNAVVAFGIYLALLLDMRDERNEHSLARATLLSAILASFILIIFDIWYLIFGTIVRYMLMVD